MYLGCGRYGKVNSSIRRREQDIYQCILDAIYMQEQEVVQKVDETISKLPKISQGGLLTIDRYPVCEGDGMFEKGIYLYIYYC